MTRLPVLDIALEGFRLTRERPLHVLLWGLVLVAGQAVGAAVLIASGQAGALAVMRRGAATPEEMNARLAELAPALPALAVAALVGLAAVSVVYTALLRTVLRPEPSRTGALRLGGDEMRQFALSLALSAVGWLALLAAIMGAVIVVTPLAMAAGGAQPLITALAMALASAAVIYLLVRLSLAPARTFAEARFALFRAWPLTRGAFWPLLAAYVLAWALGLVVYTLASTVVGAGWAAASGRGLAAATEVLQPDLSGWAAAATPASLAGLVVNGLLNALMLAILAGPGPAAYRALSR